MFSDIAAAEFRADLMVKRFFLSRESTRTSSVPGGVLAVHSLLGCTL